MAPNRKTLSTIVESLADLDLASAVKSEYLPLTATNAEVEQRCHLENLKDGTLAASHQNTPYQDLPSSPQDDYWTWTPTETEQEEEARTVLSADKIEADLIEASADYDQQHYWDETKNDTVESTNESYWDWSGNPHGNVLTMAHIESLLMRRNQSSSSVEVTSEAERNDYWDTTSAKDREERCGSNKATAAYWEWPSTNAGSAELVARGARQKTEADSTPSVVRAERLLVALAQQNYWTFDSGEEPAAAVEKGPVGYWDWNPAERQKNEPIPCGYEYWTWPSQ